MLNARSLISLSFFSSPERRSSIISFLYFFSTSDTAIFLAKFKDRAVAAFSIAIKSNSLKFEFTAEITKFTLV